MKLYIQSASMLFTYSGEALDTYEKVTNGKDILKLNTLYVNEHIGQIFYINDKGYLHVLVLGNHNHNVEDCVLTKDNLIKHSSWYCERGTEDWQQLQEDIKHAERV